MNTIEIKFTEEQYEKMIQLMCLGEWVVNAHRTSDIVTKFNELEQHIYSYAEKIGLKKFIIFDEELNKFFPTREFEEGKDIFQYIDDYNDDTFWDELIERLAHRDFLKQYKKDALKNMSREEYFSKKNCFINKYEEEFAKAGIENLILKKS